MTAAANIEIFLASLGIAGLLALGALRAAFLLMGTAGAAGGTQAMGRAGASAGRHHTVRQASPSGELALARARSGQGTGRRSIR
ncbi:MAG TPA: hypothetical protein VGZ48_08495 [Candidatus Acidoferrales bacterium]|nr:hypothetical protein [Candidatus Acidoferrales bacterium]